MKKNSQNLLVYAFVVFLAFDWFDHLSRRMMIIGLDQMVTNFLQSYTIAVIGGGVLLYNYGYKKSAP